MDWQKPIFHYCIVLVFKNPTLQHGKTSVYSIVWNQKDARKIATCGGDNYWFVILSNYLLSTSSSRLDKEFEIRPKLE